jgi:hypothetical protein
MKKHKCVICKEKRLCLKIVQTLGDMELPGLWVCRKCLKPTAHQGIKE